MIVMKQVNPSNELNISVNIHKVSYKYLNSIALKYLKTCGDEISVDYKAVQKFMKKFAKITTDKTLTAEQVYNTDEKVCDIVLFQENIHYI